MDPPVTGRRFQVRWPSYLVAGFSAGGSVAVAVDGLSVWNLAFRMLAIGLFVFGTIERIARYLDWVESRWDAYRKVPA